MNWFMIGICGAQAVYYGLCAYGTLPPVDFTKISPETSIAIAYGAGAMGWGCALMYQRILKKFDEAFNRLGI